MGEGEWYRVEGEGRVGGGDVFTKLSSSRNPLRAPSVHTIYSSLRDHNRIVRVQVWVFDGHVRAWHYQTCAPCPLPPEGGCSGADHWKDEAAASPPPVLEDRGLPTASTHHCLSSERLKCCSWRAGASGEGESPTSREDKAIARVPQEH